MSKLKMNLEDQEVIKNALSSKKELELFLTAFVKSVLEDSIKDDIINTITVKELFYTMYKMIESATPDKEYNRSYKE